LVNSKAISQPEKVTVERSTTMTHASQVGSGVGMERVATCSAQVGTAFPTFQLENVGMEGTAISKHATQSELKQWHNINMKHDVLATFQREKSDLNDLQP
jgi:hypothetical protein